MYSAEIPPITGAVVAYDRYSTPHYQAALAVSGKEGRPPEENQDFGLWMPDVGLVAGDGVGGRVGGAMASRVVVKSTLNYAKSTRLREMPADEAVDAVREFILPWADLDLAIEKEEQAKGKSEKEREEIRETSSALGGLLLARNHVIAFGAGDTPVHRVDAASGQITQVTEDQHTFSIETHGSMLTNYMSGLKYLAEDVSISVKPGPRDHYVGVSDIHDQIIAIPMQPGDRYLVASDGLHGDYLDQQIAHDILQKNLLTYNDAEKTARHLAQLPLRLWHEGHKVELSPDETYPYQFKYDDLIVGTMFIGRGYL